MRAINTFLKNKKRVRDVTVTNAASSLVSISVVADQTMVVAKTVARSVEAHRPSVRGSPDVPAPARLRKRKGPGKTSKTTVAQEQKKVQVM